MDWVFISTLFLAVFFTSVAGIYIARLTFADKTKTIQKVHTGKKFSQTWWNHMLFRYFRALIWIVCIARVFTSSIDPILGVFPSLLVAPVLIAGMCLMCIGFCIALVSHNQLGSAWRSGIDPNGPDFLQHRGLYRFSRNPMYIGVITAQLGFFLALPSVFTLICLVFGVATISVQVHAEEKHLKKAMPRIYRNYVTKVPRWLLN